MSEPVFVPADQVVAAVTGTLVGLAYLVCFSCGKPGHRVGRCPQFGRNIALHVAGMVGGKGG